MKRVSGSRGDHVGVLRARPVLDQGNEPVDRSAGPRRVDELRLLLQLVDRGLLSEEELDTQLALMFALGPGHQPKTSGGLNRLGP